MFMTGRMDKVMVARVPLLMTWVKVTDWTTTGVVLKLKK